MKFKNQQLIIVFCAFALKLNSYYQSATPLCPMSMSLFVLFSLHPVSSGLDKIAQPYPELPI
jgi:hypothetical protein